MGNFYTNITLDGVSPREVAECMRGIHRRCVVSPTNKGVTIVWDCASETQDDSVDRLAEHLSATFQ